MPKLWGRLSSINVQKATWCLDEIGAPYERVDAGGAFGIVDTPAYRAMNPNGLVPVLDDDGFVLWESNSIVRYLAAKHPETGLWPDDPRIRADADRWMDWQATRATPAMRDCFWQLVRAPETARDPALIARSVAASAEVAAILDAHLAARAYVAGDAFTVGDIAVGAHAKRWLALPIERPRLPNLDGWFRRLAERPGAAAVMALPLS